MFSGVVVHDVGASGILGRTTKMADENIKESGGRSKEESDQLEQSNKKVQISNGETDSPMELESQVAETEMSNGVHPNRRVVGGLTHLSETNGIYWFKAGRP